MIEKDSKAYMYVVECADGTLYTGYTTDVERRLNWAIPCAHLKGQWQIDLLIDDILYHSNEVAEF